MPRRPDPFAHDARDGSAYRQQRLEEDRHRLQRRLVWAESRGNPQPSAAHPQIVSPAPRVFPQIRKIRRHHSPATNDR